MRLERENCCDDVVVSIRGNAHEYAVALAALEQNRLSGRQSAIAPTGGNLVKRIRRLLYPKTNGPWAPFLAVTILIATGVVSLAAWESEPYESSSSAVQSEAERTLGPSYSKWINQDVVYIIDDSERAAFQRLTAGEERDKFIEQFWLRRDPSPGTPKNEFKEEHYRRLAYANQHFRTVSGALGWQTDRGHMYIVYGPPDEMESHPRGAQGSSAVEIWLYHHVDGIGDNGTVTFVDHTGHGDFRLAPGNTPGLTKGK